MKSFLALSCLLALALSANADGEDWKEKMMAAKEICSKEFTIDEEAMKKVWVDHMVPEDKNMLCYTACMFNQFGLIKDHKYNLDGALSMNKMHFSGDDLAKAEKISNMCSKEVQMDLTDDCELAKKLMTCYFKGLKDEGLMGH